MPVSGAKDEKVTLIPAVRGSDRYVVGVDFGTPSGRAVVARVDDGQELATVVHEYPHAVIERELPGTGRPLPPDWALEHPEDWREVLRTVVPAALAVSGVDPAHVIGIAIASTPSRTHAERSGSPATAEGAPPSGSTPRRSRSWRRIRVSMPRARGG